MIHYFGYFFKCEKRDDIQDLFPDESMWCVYDGNGSKEINTYHIYIPNKVCERCFTLDGYETGIIPIDLNVYALVPEIIQLAGKILRANYKEVELKCGVVSFVF